MNKNININYDQHLKILIDLNKHYIKWLNKELSIFSCKNKYERVNGSCYLYNVRSKHIFVHDQYIAIKFKNKIYFLLKMDNPIYDWGYEEAYNNILKAKKYKNDSRLRIDYFEDLREGDTNIELFEDVGEKQVRYITKAKFKSNLDTIYNPRYKHHDFCVIF